MNVEDAGKIITEEEKKALDILEIDTEIEKLKTAGALHRLTLVLENL